LKIEDGDLKFQLIRSRIKNSRSNLKFKMADPRPIRSQSGVEFKIQDGQEPRCRKDLCGCVPFCSEVVWFLCLTDVMECTDRELCEALDAFEAAMVNVDHLPTLLIVIT